ncbi:MAG: FABP family protein [Actinomycetota bacterium]|nr:FABP family protein [Actinomycetota bacterium]
MVFTIPEGLHPDLNPLAWMIGTWRGKGHGDYPTIDSFDFAQEVVFNHDGRPFLTFYSRSWLLDKEGEILRPGASETGFWRIKANNVLEVVISHSSGISEGWVGTFDGPKIQLVLDRGYSAPSAKIVTAGVRLYGLVASELFYAYDMATQGQELQAHIWSSLERQRE